MSLENKLARFEILFNNPEEVFFAGQEITGKVVIEAKEPKKVNEILLELKGRAKAHWVNKSRKNFNSNETYFCEQFNTTYTHQFQESTTTNNKKTNNVNNSAGKSRSNTKERILPVGLHEIPFSYTLPKTLPSSFEGDFGFVRYTCKAICERPWDFDIVCTRAFTVIGIEDINDDESLGSTSTATAEHAVSICCLKRGTVRTELRLNRSGFTPGEEVPFLAKINNLSTRTVKWATLRLIQHVTYRARTFVGAEQTKITHKTVVQLESGANVPPRSMFTWKDARLIVPSVPPQLSKCKSIEVSYSLDLQTSLSKGVVTSLPIVVGTIPLLTDILTKIKALANGESNGRHRVNESLQNHRQRMVHVTITDESGNTISTTTSKQSPRRNHDNDDEDDDQMGAEAENLASARKRVRMPSSILSELYPTLPSPYYREVYSGQVFIADDKERSPFIQKSFAPKYPHYTE